MNTLLINHLYSRCFLVFCYFVCFFLTACHSNPNQSEIADNDLLSKHDVDSIHCELGLLQAIKSNDLPSARKLEQEGCRLDRLKKQENLLLYPVQTGNYEMVAWLLENGVNPNGPDKSGISPFFIAAEKGPTSIFKLLLDEGGAILSFRERDNYLCYQNTALSSAIIGTQWEHVDLLLKHGAKVGTDSLNGFYAPLLYVFHRGHIDLFKKFIQMGSDVNDMNHIPALQDHVFRGDSSTIMHLICASGNGYIHGPDTFYQMFHAVLDQYSDINQLDDRGNTPLFEAISNRNFDLIDTLLELGAKLEVPGFSALMMPAYYSDLEMVGFLLDKGANPNYRSEIEGTPILSCLFGFTNDFGNPIELSAHVKTIELLLDAGANPSPKFKKGSWSGPSLLDTQQPELINLLKQRGLLGERD